MPDVRTNLLLAHDWKLSAATTTFNRDGKAEVLDGYATTSPCAQDNITKFNADKSISYGEGAVSCALPADREEPRPGSWSFNKDQTELTINRQQLHDADEVFDVLDLSERTLQIRRTYTYRINNRDYTGVEDYTYTGL